MCAHTIHRIPLNKIQDQEASLPHWWLYDCYIAPCTRILFRLRIQSMSTHQKLPAETIQSLHCWKFIHFRANITNITNITNLQPTPNPQLSTSTSQVLPRLCFPGPRQGGRFAQQHRRQCLLQRPVLWLRRGHGVRGVGGGEGGLLKGLRGRPRGARAGRRAPGLNSVDADDGCTMDV